MSHRSQDLSVMDIAEICGVARSTVSYWIAKKSLPAYRRGRRHMVSAEDLFLFLKSEGYRIPEVLLENKGVLYAHPLKPFKRCWEYWANDFHSRKCRQCDVLNYKIEECFTARANCDGQGAKNCHRCSYFSEYYGQHVGFVHQIDKPAFVFKGLYLWLGNQVWAELCSAEIEELVGAGLEEFVHSDSLKEFLGYARIGTQSQIPPGGYEIFLTDKTGKKVEVYLTTIRLISPAHTWLAIAEKTS